MPRVVEMMMFRARSKRGSRSVCTKWLYKEAIRNFSFCRFARCPESVSSKAKSESEVVGG